MDEPTPMDALARWAAMDWTGTVSLCPDCGGKGRPPPGAVVVGGGACARCGTHTYWFGDPPTGQGVAEKPKRKPPVPKTLKRVSLDRLKRAVDGVRGFKLTPEEYIEVTEAIANLGRLVVGLLEGPITGVTQMEEHERPVELDREVDGRHIAEIPSLPGVMAYGATEEEAVARVRRLERAVARVRRLERLVEDAEDAAASEASREEMRRTGTHPRPWREVAAEMGMDPDAPGLVPQSRGGAATPEELLAHATRDIIEVMQANPRKAVETNAQFRHVWLKGYLAALKGAGGKTEQVGDHGAIYVDVEELDKLGDLANAAAAADPLKFERSVDDGPYRAEELLGKVMNRLLDYGFQHYGFQLSADSPLIRAALAGLRLGVELAKKGGYHQTHSRAYVPVDRLEDIEDLAKAAEGL